MNCMNSLISHQNINNNHVPYGNVYIMTHSIFSNVVKIGCTPTDTEEYAKSLSAQSPGEYALFYSLACDNPCQIKQKIRNLFSANQYINEFYEVSPEKAKNILNREIMKIPVNSTH